MSLPVVLTVVGAVLTLLGTLGVSYAVFRTNVVTKTIELYKSENEILGKAVARLGIDVAAAAEKIRTLEETNRVLRSTVTGEVAISALADTIRGYQDPIYEAHRTQLEVLQRILDAVQEREKERRGS
ncbi:MAG: hypothetical protein LC798_19090 [Chloroflexi bacterium]|nr:hypothetical protein [Chloroflexota bacterium]